MCSLACVAAHRASVPQRGASQPLLALASITAMQQQPKASDHAVKPRGRSTNRSIALATPSSLFGAVMASAAASAGGPALPIATPSPHRRSISTSFSPSPKARQAAGSTPSLSSSQPTPNPLDAPSGSTYRWWVGWWGRWQTEPGAGSMHPAAKHTGTCMLTPRITAHTHL